VNLIFGGKAEWPVGNMVPLLRVASARLAKAGFNFCHKAESSQPTARPFNFKINSQQAESKIICQ
jgi:hypothetical protein